jgi:hypothetical protein
MKRSAKLSALAGVATLAVVLAGCGTSDGDGGGGADTAAGGFTAPDLEMKTEIGEFEGQVNILAWPGYAEDGSSDPEVDWVTPFEEETGCQANVKYFATSDEAVSLMKTGEYDVVSASGDASLRLIASGDVEPVNTDLTENYADVYDLLNDRDWNSVDGQMYGVPHGYGANLLMWRTDVVKPAPTSWGAVFEADSPYKGKVTATTADLHRRRCALPHGDPARPRYREPLRPRRGAAPGRRRPAQAAAGERRRVLVGLPQGDPGLHHRRLGARHDLAGHRQRRAGREGAGRRGAPRRGRDRLVGHLDGAEGEEPQRRKA